MLDLDLLRPANRRNEQKSTQNKKKRLKRMLNHHIWMRYVCVKSKLKLYHNRERKPEKGNRFKNIFGMCW